MENLMDKIKNFITRFKEIFSVIKGAIKVITPWVKYTKEQFNALKSEIKFTNTARKHKKDKE